MKYLLVLIFLLILFLLYVYIRHFTADYSFFKKTTLSLGIILFTLSIIVNPGESYKAAYDGLSTWFNIVCPSLLPFFIGSELLINLGIINFIGILLEPVMRPVFNVPGCGSFPFVMSITSGYPVGSKIVARLYSDNMCTKTEAQRLMSFCSTSGPLFMIGAVAIGMLNFENGGGIIAISHYLGALTVGFLFRFYKYGESTRFKVSNNSIKKAFQSLVHSFENEKRPLGLLLSDSVKNSVNALLSIGGFIVLFSVIIRLMLISGIIDIAAGILYNILSPFGAGIGLLKSIISSLFEITIGCKLIASSEAFMIQKILAVCTVISWSGFSIHAQVASMISKTDIKMSTYIFSKAMHAVFSWLYAYIIVSLRHIPGIEGALQVFSYNKEAAVYNLDWTAKFTISSGRFIIFTLILLSAALLYVIVSKAFSAFSH